MSQFAAATSQLIHIDLGAYWRAREAGSLEVHAHACLCPGCWAKWTAEYLGLPEQFARKPDPVRLGLALLCGTCEAKRRLLCGQGRDARPFFGEAETATAWGRIRNQARPWVEVTNLGQWEGRPLRDDKAEMLASYVRYIHARGGFLVSDEIREHWGWSSPRTTTTQPTTASVATW